MKKYIFILFIALLVSSDSLWACVEILMPHQKVIKVNLSESEVSKLGNTLLISVEEGNYPLAKLLLAAGVNPNIQIPITDHCKSSPLFK